MNLSARLALSAFLVAAAIPAASSIEIDEGTHAVMEYVTYPVPDAVEEGPYTLSVGGKVLPIERAGSRRPAYYTRVQLVAPFRATLSVKAAGRAEIDLKPERFREGVELTNGVITFEVAKPGPRVFSCTVNGRELPPFVLLVDDYDPQAERPDLPGMVDIRDYSITSDGLQTAKIQKALDDIAARPGGGTLYFGPGVYHTGSLKVGSNTTLYLAPGALIQGSSDPKDYAEHDNGRQLILLEDCSNSSIHGYGVIDGAGYEMQSTHGKKAHLIDVINSTDISIEGVVLRDAGAWNLHVLGCERVAVDNLKVLSDWAAANTDGIDPDCSSDVTITRYFGFCGDDAIAIKTSGRAGVQRPSRNIQVRDSVIVTLKTALKVGTETREDISDVVFENIDVINSSRGIGLWCFDGHKFFNFVFRDIRLDLREFEGEEMSGEPYRVHVADREGVGRIENIVFERVTAHAPYRSIIFGHPDSFIENVTLNDCSWTVTPRHMKSGKYPVLELWNCRNAVIENTTVSWYDRQRDLWTSFIGQTNTDNVIVRNSVEVHR